jgi:hypothetical protein
VLGVFDIYNKREDLIDVISCERSLFFLAINGLSERDNRHNETAVLLQLLFYRIIMDI